MSREIEGYYDEGRGPSKTDIPMLNVIFDAIHSHNGWSCPHCGEKDDVMNSGMSSDLYFDLIHNNDGPLEMTCGHCEKTFYLKCRMTLKYSTCADKSFGEK